jgi:hypothetical protein
LPSKALITRLQPIPGIRPRIAAHGSFQALQCAAPHHATASSENVRLSTKWIKSFDNVVMRAQDFAPG